VRIVIGFLRMVEFGGTESYVLTVAGELERLGHDVLVYVHETGPSAEFARAHGARIVERVSELPASCDAVFSQDAATAYELAVRYPDAARIYVAHSSGYPLQSPPQAPETCHAVVVMNDRLLRRTEGLGWHPEIVRLRQPIDLLRFSFRALGIEPGRRPRVLVLSNYTTAPRGQLIEEACRRAGLELRLAGALAVPTPAPEHEIAKAEIVIALGRGALEAMASGRAAYVLGEGGGDGWATEDTYPAIESDGFGGRALGHAISLERLTDDLSAWDSSIGEVGRDLVCTHHNVVDHALALVELAERLTGSVARPPAVADEFARLVRLEWDANTRLRSAIGQAKAFRAQVTALEAEVRALTHRVVELEPEAALGASSRAELERLEAELVRARAETAELRDLRRFRIACHVAKPLDRLRAALRPRP